MSYKVVDSKDREIKVGTKVELYGYDPENDAWPAYHGVVLAIHEWDTDVNDYGRPILIPPRVVVQFDDGEQDGFSAQPHEKFQDVRFVENIELFVCEDLDVTE